jgi:hypothetical protein
MFRLPDDLKASSKHLRAWRNDSERSASPATGPAFDDDCSEARRRESTPRARYKGGNAGLSLEASLTAVVASRKK